MRLTKGNRNSLPPKARSIVGCVKKENSRGVCILLNPSLNCTFENIHKDQSGRIISIDLNFNSNNFSLCNIYAPNDQRQQQEFIHNLSTYLMANTDMVTALIVHLLQIVPHSVTLNLPEPYSSRALLKDGPQANTGSTIYVFLGYKSLVLDALLQFQSAKRNPPQKGIDNS